MGATYQEAMSTPVQVIYRFLEMQKLEIDMKNVKAEQEARQNAQPQ